MKKLLALAALASLSSMASAAIGPAGCGLGNVVFGKESQIFAATTNGSFGNQTFGITSGTSNCGGAGGMARLENFIEINQVALANDVARGQGETIEGLAQILGCSNSTQLGAELKANYSNVFGRPSATASELTSGVKNAVQKNVELNRSCGNV